MQDLIHVKILNNLIFGCCFIFFFLCLLISEGESGQFCRGEFMTNLTHLSFHFVNFYSGNF